MFVKDAEIHPRSEKIIEFLCNEKYMVVFLENF